MDWDKMTEFVRKALEEGVEYGKSLETAERWVWDYMPSDDVLLAEVYYDVDEFPPIVEDICQVVQNVTEIWDL